MYVCLTLSMHSYTHIVSHVTSTIQHVKNHKHINLYNYIHILYVQAKFVPGGKNFRGGVQIKRDIYRSDIVVFSY